MRYYARSGNGVVIRSKFSKTVALIASIRKKEPAGAVWPEMHVRAKWFQFSLLLCENVKGRRLKVQQSSLCACHEGRWGNGGINPLSPNLGIRWSRISLYKVTEALYKY